MRAQGKLAMFLLLPDNLKRYIYQKPIYQRYKSKFKMSSYKKYEKTDNRIIINLNSLRNKFDLLTYQINDNIDILMIEETKLDESFPIGQFFS